MTTKDQLFALLQIVEAWGWVAAMPKNPDRHGGIDGMIIGTQEFVDRILKDETPRFYFPAADEDSTH